VARKSTGKRLRFEIFKRDGFRCVYCGATPSQSLLRVDHVCPVSKGGTNEPANLVTACHDCNGGKSDIPLEQRRLVSQDPEALQEQADQLRLYLKAQRALTKARREMEAEICAQWNYTLGPISQEMAPRLASLLSEWSYEDLHRAMCITAKKLGKMSAYSYSGRAGACAQQKYFSGVLRNWREGK
jgi:hypothetical protein